MLAVIFPGLNLIDDVGSIVAVSTGLSQLKGFLKVQLSQFTF
jgi:hypothetical protein